MPIVLKSVNLNLLETSGPLQACSGIALPLPLHRTYVSSNFTDWPLIGLQGCVLVIICEFDPVRDGPRDHVLFYRYECHRQYSKGQMAEAWLTTREIEKRREVLDWTYSLATVRFCMFIARLPKKVLYEWKSGVCVSVPSLLPELTPDTAHWIR